MERFWSKVDKRGSDECWPWKGCLDRGGYGRFSLKLRAVLAHRMAYHLSHGDPGDLVVMHACDNRPCCNPAHLSLGTSQDNNLDMYRKGRVAVGNALPQAKMTADDVISARDRYRSGYYSFEELAAEHGVHAKVMRAAVLGHTWKHLSGAVPAGLRSRWGLRQQVSP